jgi:hypothetical protein
VARTIRKDGLGTDLAIGVAVLHRLGTSSQLGIDLGYLRLGTRDDAGPTLIFPGPAPGTFTSSARHRLYHVGIVFHQRLFTAPVTPSLLLGTGYYGLAARSTFVVRDSLGQINRTDDDSGTFWGPGVSAGVTLALPVISRTLVPQLQVRGHVSLVHTTESWSEYDAMSVAVALAW